MQRLFSCNSFVISCNNVVSIVNWRVALSPRVDLLIKLVKQTFVFFSAYSVILSVYKVLLLQTIYFGCYYYLPHKLILNFVVIHNKIHNKWCGRHGAKRYCLQVSTWLDG